MSKTNLLGHVTIEDQDTLLGREFKLSVHIDKSIFKDATFGQLEDWLDGEQVAHIYDRESHYELIVNLFAENNPEFTNEETKQ